jgi:transcriptional/translational regulatory protein YebC/TACO1
VAINKNGGSLGETGSVAYMFDRKGYIAIVREGLDVDEDTMLMSVLEAGGEELEASEEVFEIYTDASDFADVRDTLEKEGYVLAQAELTMVPQMVTDLSEEQQAILETIVDALEDDDDVSDVYTSANM